MVAGLLGLVSGPVFHWLERRFVPWAGGQA